jgi:hypothetical protein
MPATEITPEAIHAALQELHEHSDRAASLPGVPRDSPAAHERGARESHHRGLHCDAP